ncbi:MAG: Asp-tRNA(Asn)/Glu-tRNA(Gln) amidotransferase subunit GatC [Nitrospirae bacterium]|nr:Asp-tRNA(Asn)/Glu-tRNA(Gln) amidotransferase subunit GatC [Nitrospirota bacterium]
MEITRSQVEHVAKLARLAIGEDEKALFARQLSAILTYVETLNRLDTSSVEPTSHVIPLQNVFREDEVKPSLSRDQALANAPDIDGGCFRVPKIIE